MKDFAPSWQQKLDALAAEHHLPGASLAVYHAGEQVEITTGVANVSTGVPTTPDTLFLIASVTKIFTATAIMRLVDQGRLALDEPIKKFIPEMRLADREAEETITLRHLLTHTAGIEGDNFLDFGRGDDYLAKFVDAYADMPQVFPPGRFHSYCNAGFNFMARAAEIATGDTWDAVLRSQVLEPLGVDREAVTLPEDAILHRVAVGHLGGDEPAPVRKWELRRAQVPSGGVIASARSLLALAKLHLGDGQGPDGTSLVSAELIAEMQRPQAKEPGISGDFPARGLAWVLDEVAGHRLVGHGGNTDANSAKFAVFPDLDFAFVLLTNAGSGASLVSPMFSAVVGDVLGFDASETYEDEAPELPATPPDVDLGRYVGVWEQVSGRLTVEMADDGLRWSFFAKGDMEGIASDIPNIPLQPVTKELFVALIPTGAEPIRFPIRFFEFDDDGRPQFMHLSSRMARRDS